METAQVNMNIDFANWNALFKDRQWLEQQTAKEAEWLKLFINELWHNNAILVWDMICEQKAWLQTHTDETAHRLAHFLEMIQDAGVDTEEFQIDEIYGLQPTQIVTLKSKATHHLKLVVSNYFRPMDRINQPCKPDPVLTLLP